MTPTSPWPDAVRGFNELITEKLVSNEVTLSPEGTVAVPEDDDDGVLVEPQAATSPAIPSTAPQRTARVILLEPIFVRIAGSSWF
jgi:hypothetical protein